MLREKAVKYKQYISKLKCLQWYYSNSLRKEIIWEILKITTL